MSHTLTIPEKRTYLEKIFAEVKDVYPIYTKIYTTLTTYTLLPDDRIDALYDKTKTFGLEHYQHFVEHAHKKVRDTIEQINTQERLQQNKDNADDFLQNHLNGHE